MSIPYDPNDWRRDDPRSFQSSDPRVYPTTVEIRGGGGGSSENTPPETPPSLNGILLDFEPQLDRISKVLQNLDYIGDTLEGGRPTPKDTDKIPIPPNNTLNHAQNILRELQSFAYNLEQATGRIGRAIGDRQK